MKQASDRVDLSEQETRAIIDRQLRQRGWTADSDSFFDADLLDEMNDAMWQYDAGA